MERKAMNSRAESILQRQPHPQNNAQTLQHIERIYDLIEQRESTELAQKFKHECSISMLNTQQAEMIYELVLEYYEMPDHQIFLSDEESNEYVVYAAANAFANHHTAEAMKKNPLTLKMKEESRSYLKNIKNKKNQIANHIDWKQKRLEEKSRNMPPLSHTQPASLEI